MTNKNKDKIFEVVLTNIVALITFYALYVVGSNYFTDVRRLFWVPLIMLIVFLISDDVKTFKRSNDCTAGV